MAGLYLHIPFCKQACSYCDFHFSTSLKSVDQMTESICREIILKKNRIGRQIETIYLGGGTPSVLPVKNLLRIFDTIDSVFEIANNAEITLEANPDDLYKEKVADLRKLPVNRLSIGIQSFFNEDLLWMNRAHNADEAQDCIKRVQDSGYENLSIDLIFGYPSLSNTKLITNIEQAVALQIPHISAYALTVEERTALANAIKKGKQKPLHEEQSAEQFMLMNEKLTSENYEQYEISNYSLPGQHAVHNTNYWKGIPYLGIGPSAHGFDGEQRSFNVANNAKYIESLSNDKLPESFEKLTVEDNVNEYIMTSLRTMWGTDLKKIEADFGRAYAADIREQLKPFLANGHVRLENNIILLTKEGKLFADGIAASLFVENEK